MGIIKFEVVDENALVYERPSSIGLSSLSLLNGSDFSTGDIESVFLFGSD